MDCSQSAPGDYQRLPGHLIYKKYQVCCNVIFYIEESFNRQIPKKQNLIKKAAYTKQLFNYYVNPLISESC